MSPTVPDASTRLTFLLPLSALSCGETGLAEPSPPILLYHTTKSCKVPELGTSGQQRSLYHCWPLCVTPTDAIGDASCAPSWKWRRTTARLVLEKWAAAESRPRPFFAR